MLNSTEASRSQLSLWQLAVIGGLVLVAIFGVVIGTGHGPGATPDSATYASVAQNLARGQGLKTYDGGELTLFPPGLPSLLALGGVFGLDAPAAARLVNALSLAAVVLLAAVLVRRSVASVPLQLAGVALVALAPVLIGVSVMLWSEAPFIAVTLAFLVVLERAAAERRASLVVTAALLAGAGFLLRYPGLVLIGFGIVALAWQPVRSRDLNGAGSVGLFAGIAALPVSGWLLHNQAHGALLGSARSPIENRVRAGEGLLANTQQVFDTVGAWLVPRGGLVVLGIVGATAIAIVFTQRRAGETSSSSSNIALLGGFSMFYIVLVVAGASVTYVDPLGDRLLSPVYVPLLVVALVIVERPLGLLEDRPRLQRALIIASAVWLLIPSATWLGRVRTAADGVGFTSAQWQQSSLVELVRRSADGPPLYSNWPDGTYYVAGTQPVRFGPADSAASRREFAAVVHCTGPVRFAEYVYRRPLLLTPKEFGPSVRVELIDTVADGSLYEVSSNRDPSSGECSDAATP